MAAKKSAKKSRQVMDVSKPGKTPADPSSRPIIVGHKPMAEDPMVSKKADKEAEEDPGDRIKVSRTAPKVIKPLSDNTADAKPTDTVESPEETTEPEADEETPAASEEATTKPDTSAETEDEDQENSAEPEPTSEEAATVDAVAGQTPDKKAEATQAEAHKKQQEHLDKLIADKQYFLPIRATKRKRRAQWLLLLLVLLVAGVVAYLLLYTDFKPSDIKLPTFLGGTSQTDSTNTDPPRQETEETTTEPNNPATPTPAAKDTERRDDINAVASRLESYHISNERYPTLAQLNNSTFRAQDLGGLAPDAFQDPDGTAALLAANAAPGTYGYTASPSGCDNTAAICTSFVLSAVLSDGTRYEKASLN